MRLVRVISALAALAAVSACAAPEPSARHTTIVATTASTPTVTAPPTADVTPSGAQGLSA